MEAMVKKYQQRFRKVRECMGRWDELQSRLISQFNNASSIIERLEIIHDSRNYGVLNGVDGISNAVLIKQMDSLESILLSITKTLEDFGAIVATLQKINRDGRQLVKGSGSGRVSMKQLQQRVGIKPCLEDCIDGLIILHHMHHSEYLLKSSVVSGLSVLTLKPSSSDLGALRQLLIDQPNIPKEEGNLLMVILVCLCFCSPKSITIGASTTTVAAKPSWACLC